MKSDNDSIEVQLKELLEIANEIGLKINIEKIQKDIINEEKIATFKIFVESMRFLKFFYSIEKSASEKCDLEELNKLPIFLSISKLYEALEDNHEIAEELKKLSVSLIKFALPSFELHLNLIKMPRLVRFEEQIRKLLITSYKKAYKLSPRAVAKVFYEISTFYQNKPQPREVLKKAPYSELGIPSSIEEIKDLSLKDFMHLINKRKDILFEFDENKIADITRELIRRFGGIIEIQLKLIFSVIINLMRIGTKQEFVKPNNLMKFYIHQLSIEREPDDKGNYLDIRNCNAHDTLQIIVDRENKDIQIIFILQYFNPDGSIDREESLPAQSIDEIYNKMEAFIKFSDLFQRFFLAYIIDWQLKKEGKSYDEIIDKLQEEMDKKNLQQEIANLFREIQEKLDKD